MVVVRDATPADADAIADAHVAAWRVGYAHVFPAELLDGPDFERSRRDAWRAWRPEAGRYLRVPEVDGRVVGFAAFGPERPRPTTPPSIRAEVYGFYLHPDVWGSGVAGALMRDAEDRLARDGFAEAVLWVLDDNPRARAFYARAGWAATGRRAAFDQYCDAQVPEVEYRKELT